MEIPENKKQFEITEKFIGWGSAYVWAETEEEAIRLYRLGEYDDYETDFDNFQEQPTTYDSELGGTTTFLDCGAGKGGKLFGAIVNTDTNIVEEYLDFTDVL